MHRIRIILPVVIIATFFISCIEPFNPDIGNKNAAKYVVFGQITDQEGDQTVKVSTTSTLENPNYKPLTGCTVKIIDDIGNSFSLSESVPGSYTAWIAKEYLIPGNSYRVDITTSSGEKIESEFDQMPESPKIDSIYFIREDVQTTNPEKPLQGLQFYIDLDGENTNSHYYRWEITESWEHHAAFAKVWYWNTKNLVKLNPPDYSKMICWTIQKIQTIYTLSTEKLTQNKYSRFKLHFVDNLTQRLTYCYSLLINQYAISETSYKYWDNLRINSNEQGGLYEIQPLHIKGNLKNTSNPEFEVLGLFSASSVRTKRIFVRDLLTLPLLYPECVHFKPDRGDLNKFFPRYLLEFDGGLEILDDACVECDIQSGSNVKPDYWPY